VRIRDGAGSSTGDQSDGAVRIRRLRAIARFMDSSLAIPGLGVRVGIDPIVGLLPGVGDALTTLVSLYIVHEGYKLGASRSQIARMLGNIAIDLLIGSVPVLGDLFDFAFKANTANLRILGIDPDAD